MKNTIILLGFIAILISACDRDDAPLKMYVINQRFEVELGETVLVKDTSQNISTTSEIINPIYKVTFDSVKDNRVWGGDCATTIYTRALGFVSLDSTDTDSRSHRFDYQQCTNLDYPIDPSYGYLESFGNLDLYMYRIRPVTLDSPLNAREDRPYSIELILKK